MGSRSETLSHTGDRSEGTAPGVPRREPVRCLLAPAIGSLLIALALGCGSPTPEVASSANGTAHDPTPAPIPPQVYSIPLRGEPAREYETELTSTSPMSAAVSRRFPNLEASLCLERAARAHADLPQGWEPRLPLAFTEFTLHWAGCPDPTATLSVLLTNEPGPSPLLTELAGVVADGSYTHIGIAGSAAPPPYARRWFVLLVERRVAMKPIPTSASPGTSLALQFRLDDGFDRATVAVTTPRGSTDIFDAGTSGGWVVKGVSLADEIGRQWIELIGHGANGPRVLALFPVEVGREPPRQWVGPPTSDESWVDTTEEAETLAASLVRQDRSRFDLPDIQWDPLLVEIARAHSLEMADRGYFAHISPTTGSIADRIRNAGYPARFAAENIAIAPTITEAQESLMRSPGHRAAVLSTEASHFGVGVVTRNEPNRGRVHYLTQIYARRP